jgi:hypothetical protein
MINEHKGVHATGEISKWAHMDFRLLKTMRTRKVVSGSLQSKPKKKKIPQALKKIPYPLQQIPLKKSQTNSMGRG